MCKENGIYAFEASTDAVVDYPALVNSMNKYFWADTDGNWVLKGDQVTWSEEPWQYRPYGYPTVIEESNRYIDDADGNLLLIESKKNGRCDGAIDSNIIYLDIDKTKNLSEQEIANEIGIHIKSGWIEIATVLVGVGVGDQFFTLNLRIHANGLISISESEADQVLIQRGFGVSCKSEGQRETGGDL